MILEHAILNVRPGESPAFRLAIAEALPLMTATPGFIGMEVCPCIETDFIKHYLDESLDDAAIEKACAASQIAKHGSPSDNRR